MAYGREVTHVQSATMRHTFWIPVKRQVLTHERSGTPHLWDLQKIPLMQKLQWAASR